METVTLCHCTIVLCGLFFSFLNMLTAKEFAPEFQKRLECGPFKSAETIKTLSEELLNFQLCAG